MRKDRKITSGKVVKKRIIIIVCVVLAVLFILYWVLVYFLVSAALVPSFMEKLDKFEEISDKSYSEMIWTDDITVNQKTDYADTNEWLSGVKYEKLNITSDDGYNFDAVMFLQDDYSEKWVLMLHGYTGWKEEMYRYAYHYYLMGYNILCPDLRCSGSSEGDFIGMGWTDSIDCLKWLDVIISLDPDARIVLHGQSMGAATALIMTGNSELPSNVVACVSDCAYTTAYEMFGDKCKSWFNLPAFPIVDSAVLMLKARGGYNLRDASPLDAVQKSDIPTLFIHGEDDALISVSMCYRLYDAETADKEIMIVPGAGHAQAADKDPEGFYDTIWEFLGNYGM